MIRDRHQRQVSLLSIGMVVLLGTEARGQDPVTGLPKPPPAVSSEALAKAEALVAKREAAMGRRFDPAYRGELIESLASGSPESLLAPRQDSGLVPLSPGSSTADLLYTPVAPCRIIDTRFAAGGALVANVPRDFLVAGTTGFPTQGGLAGGCGIPLGPAAAVVINFVAVNPAGPGNLRAWPAGTAVPNASIINYAAIGTNLANGLAVPICNPSCLTDLTVRADVSGAHLVADVVGFYQGYPKSRQNAFTFALVLVNSTNQNFLAGVNNESVTAGESIHVTAGFGVWGGVHDDGCPVRRGLHDHSG
jgi:hypothetical protein